MFFLENNFTFSSDGGMLEGKNDLRSTKIQIDCFRKVPILLPEFTDQNHRTIFQ